MRSMYADSGNKPGYYFGYSLGTIQMELALAKYEEEMKDYLKRAVFLTACTWPSAESLAFNPGQLLFEDLLAANVYAFNGPNWDAKAIAANESLSPTTRGLAPWIPSTS